MKGFSEIVDLTIGSLGKYAKRTKQTFPNDIGYVAIKQHTIRHLKADGVKQPGPALVDPVIEAVQQRLCSLQVYLEWKSYENAQN